VAADVDASSRGELTQIIAEPRPLALARMTSDVHRWHHLPSSGDHPLAWAEAFLAGLWSLTPGRSSRRVDDVSRCWP